MDFEACQKNFKVHIKEFIFLSVPCVPAKAHTTIPLSGNFKLSLQRDCCIRFFEIFHPLVFLIDKFRLKTLIPSKDDFNFYTYIYMVQNLLLFRYHKNGSKELNA
jgi:hypothetical protein